VTRTRNKQNYLGNRPSETSSRHLSAQALEISTACRITQCQNTQWNSVPVFWNMFHVWHCRENCPYSATELWSPTYLLTAPRHGGSREEFREPIRSASSIPDEFRYGRPLSRGSVRSRVSAPLLNCLEYGERPKLPGGGTAGVTPRGVPPDCSTPSKPPYRERWLESVELLWHSSRWQCEKRHRLRNRERFLEVSILSGWPERRPCPPAGLPQTQPASGRSAWARQH